jgi:lauroyl/myristoyl acyltransferase
MRFQDLVGGEFGVKVGLFIGQHLPPRMGHALARAISDVLVWRKPEVYRTVRANLRQVVGPEADKETLHQMVHKMLFHAGQTYYDFFRAVGQPPEVLVEQVLGSEALAAELRSEMAAGRGVLMLGVHMSNFDLLTLSMGASGVPIYMLSLAGPQVGFQILNRLRAVGQIEVTPITPGSLRTAVRRLREGGIVSTGVDWPVPDDPPVIEFFGRLSYLPLGPARLALMTDASVVIGVCHYEPDQGYLLQYTEPMQMVRSGDREADILSGAQRLAAVVEGYVRAHPSQWMMFHPMWPQPPSPSD